MEVVDFLPIYPEFDIEIQTLFGDLVDKSSLYYKKEFNDYKLQKIEETKKSGEYMNHQILMSRFLSSYTPYNGILIMHEPGTGKTCLSVSVIEKIKSEKSSFKGALILMKGQSLIKNYKKELVQKCTDGKYKIEDTDDKDEENVRMIGFDDDGSLTQNKVKRRINKKLEDFYEFQTFEVFSKKISEISDEEVMKQYNNHIIVIDEVHNLRKDEKDQEIEGQYENIHKMLHIVQNCKILLMSGTPMVDKPCEIASVMNLILDKDNQLPSGAEFDRKYMNENVLKPDTDLKSKLHGKVSFLKSMQSNVKKEFVGKKLDLDQFNQYEMKMKDTQLRVYKGALKEEEQAIYLNAREASLFVYPDGTYGKTGFNKYITQTKTDVQINKKIVKKTSYNANKQLFDLYKDVKTPKEKLEILEKYSIKYATCIRLLLDPTISGTHFIYIDFVQGSGAIVFTKLLEYFGFTNYKVKSKSKYALLTSKTSSSIDNVLKIFNSEDNHDGSKIKVIIGSKIISEGFTLKNVQNVHILTPHWNFSETDQAIARSFRLFSHQDLLERQKDVTVKIYLYTAIVNEQDELVHSKFDSIDRYMYKICENKDRSIKSIEYLLKKVSVDCMLTKERNVLPEYLNGSRNCEYQDCNYVCEYDDENKMDYSTFNMFYDQEEIEKNIEILKRLFLDKSEYSLDNLLFHFPNYYFLLKTIWYCIDNKIVFDKKGIKFFLKVENDMIYLSNFKNNNLLDSFYATHIPLELEFNFDNEIDQIYEEYLPVLFRQMKLEKDDKKKAEIMDKFPIEAKSLMLETSILLKKNGAVDPIIDYIINFFSSFIFIYDSKPVSTILKKYRWLEKDKEEWVNCPQFVVKPLIEDVVNEYGYEGFIHGDAFKIIKQQELSDLKDKKVNTGNSQKDKRLKNTGKVCQTHKKKELLDIIHKLKIDPTEEQKEKSKEELIKKLNEVDKDKNFTIYNTQELSRLFYWSQKSVIQICKVIQEKFKEKNILK